MLLVKVKEILIIIKSLFFVVLMHAAKRNRCACFVLDPIMLHKKCQSSCQELDHKKWRLLPLCWSPACFLDWVLRQSVSTQGLRPRNQHPSSGTMTIFIQECLTWEHSYPDAVIFWVPNLSFTLPMWKGATDNKYFCQKYHCLYRLIDNSVQLWSLPTKMPKYDANWEQSFCVDSLIP